MVVYGLGFRVRGVILVQPSHVGVKEGGGIGNILQYSRAYTRDP